ncbi:mechanosensitive ion channel domain-containing protein [Pseudomonas sp. NPDC007930]|uniref:mechanosensitive ion channel domain-containing protein n=1 Tax=Pseudomonas sp. NPDC007930 TaxID=3364417 RepID=UPI0036E17A3A
MLTIPTEWMLCAVALFATDLVLWQGRLIKPQPLRVAVRVLLLLAYSAVILRAGISPLQPAPWPDALLAHMAALVLAIIWWLFAARALSEVLGIVLSQRIGHSGRLLRDVVGALVFLAAVVAAAAYVIELPVKGLLATSGALAIIVGLALQSTLSDVFSGIVLNATKPYQVDDWVSIDGTEGRVLDINWRATHLFTASGATAVVPNSVAAKARIVNLSRPANLHGVSISLSIPNHVRPGRVLDALERALRGTHALLPEPAPSASVKEAGAEVTQYSASGFIAHLGQKTEVRNALFDLAYRHLEAAGVHWPGEANQQASRSRALLDEVRVFKALSAEEKDRLAEALALQEVAAGQVILDIGAVPEALVIIAAGVVSVTLKNPEPGAAEYLEAGRMGPGEVLGEQSVLDDGANLARFTALTSCQVLSVERSVIRACLANRVDVSQALQKLHALRQANSRSLLLKPVAPPKGGFLAWLHRH